MTSAELELSDGPGRPNWRVWATIAALTLLWHVFLLWLKPVWQAIPPPPRVEIQQIDPGKLDAIRKQWRTKEKQLLLNKDKSLPKEKEASPDARYMSDRNIRVEKEQRARTTNVIPKPQTAPPQPKAEPEKPRSKFNGKLGNLGVPFHMGIPGKPRQTHQPDPFTDSGDQALQDTELPVGGENLLNTQESIYYSFYARIYEAIGPIWQSRIREIPARRTVAQGDYMTFVDVVFDREGNLIDIRHLQDSGIAEFDSAVDTSWKKIGRFPNPPRGLLDEHGQVHMGWTFKVQVGPGFNVVDLPPSRNY